MTSVDKEAQSIKTGIYKVTQGEYNGAALFLVDISAPEESEFVYLTIYNPESEDSHEVSLGEWLQIAKEDSLEWQEDIPNEIKDKLLEGSFARITGL